MQKGNPSCFKVRALNQLPQDWVADAGYPTDTTRPPGLCDHKTSSRATFGPCRRLKPKLFGPPYKVLAILVLSFFSCTPIPTVSPKPPEITATGLSPRCRKPCRLQEARQHPTSPPSDLTVPARGGQVHLSLVTADVSSLSPSCPPALQRMTDRPWSEPLLQAPGHSSILCTIRGTQWASLYTVGNATKHPYTSKWAQDSPH